MTASYTIIFAATLLSSVSRQASTCFCIGPKFLCIRSTPTEIESNRGNGLKKTKSILMKYRFGSGRLETFASTPGIIGKSAFERY
jgi:hypothetical protein